MDVQIADFSSAEPIRSSILNTIIHKDHYVEAKLRMLGASEKPMSEHAGHQCGNHCDGAVRASPS